MCLMVTIIKRQSEKCKTVARIESIDMICVSLIQSERERERETEIEKETTALQVLLIL